MSTYPIRKTLQLWSRGELTAEQAIGQLLQHLQKLENRVQTLEQQTLTARKPGKGKSASTSVTTRSTR